MSPEVPVDGVLWLSWVCDGACERDQLSKVDVVELPSQKRVEGTTLSFGKLADGGVPASSFSHWSQGWSLWLPRAPLEVGKTYHVNGHAKFQAVQRTAFDPRALSVRPRLERVVEHVGPAACCDLSARLRLVRDSCDHEAGCSWTSSRERLQLELRPSGPEPDGQWLYSTRYSVDGVERASTQPQPRVADVVRLDTAGVQICYAVDAIRVADGAHVEVARACLAGDPRALRQHTMSEPAVRALVSTCSSAPRGLEGPWCQVQAERCAANEQACWDQDHFCPPTLYTHWRGVSSFVRGWYKGATGSALGALTELMIGLFWFVLGRGLLRDYRRFRDRRKRAD